jgi:hypothetical protein
MAEPAPVQRIAQMLRRPAKDLRRAGDRRLQQAGRAIQPLRRLDAAEQAVGTAARRQSVGPGGRHRMLSCLWSPGECDGAAGRSAR